MLLAVYLARKFITSFIFPLAMAGNFVTSYSLPKNTELLSYGLCSIAASMIQLKSRFSILGMVDQIHSIHHQSIYFRYIKYSV